MPVDYSGAWALSRNVNFDGYMIALGKFQHFIYYLSVKIKQNGDVFTTRAITTFRTYECSFTIGEEFKEVTGGLDSRSCLTVVNWDQDKLVCVQRGEKKNRGWIHWIEGDELHLELTCECQVCKQIYKRTL
uniref:Retinoid-binding protein 7-like n=1 Tax=Echeneis naucrates TaxID=173247 RepID=A0A665TGF6_ECHNA